MDPAVIYVPAMLLLTKYSLTVGVVLNRNDYYGFFLQMVQFGFDLTFLACGLFLGAAVRSSSNLDARTVAVVVLALALLAVIAYRLNDAVKKCCREHLSHSRKVPVLKSHFVEDLVIKLHEVLMTDPKFGRSNRRVLWGGLYLVVVQSAGFASIALAIRYGFPQ